MGSWTLVAENALRVRDAANKVQKARELCREASKTLMSVAQCIDDTNMQQFTEPVKDGMAELEMTARKLTAIEKRLHPTSVDMEGYPDGACAK